MTLMKLVYSLLIALAVAGGFAVFVDLRATAREDAAEASHPPTGQFVTINGIRLQYEVAGTGPDVILIHGAFGNLRDMTFALRDRLAAHYRVVVFDRPGFGYSDALPQGDASLIGQVQILQAAAKEIGVSNPIVVGHSYGGAVAMNWALNPGVMPPAAIVLVSAPTLPWPGSLDPLYRVTGNAFGAALIVPLATAFITDNFLHKAVAGIFAPSAVPAGYEAHVGPALSIRRMSLLANGRQVNTLYDQVVAMARQYPTLTLPVELVHGDADTSVPLSVHALPLSKLLPNAALTVIHGAGHVLHQSHPDAVVAAVDRAARRAQLP